ncbi:LysR family transcriptional regulator [Micromonospora lupini]|uniref:Transcriptional regulator, LysR family n=1 Tax=Micromonospora lupini str. Lupac 08 TaxID=1150864 RepID=I0L6N7_9ACTN|nr:LysR family transcriptional regulator [Micromonospora lupini]CCH19484.1 Transcriptional regulator, LysR family [Micromonospora lupini str. Lupac 08]
MLDVRRLILLRDLAHLGTIAAVAQAHAYTPSAVSQQLAALQREAGTRLLERTGRRVGLTSTATALVQHTEVILAALEAADATVAAARTGLRGRVRIGAFPSAVRTLLPAALVGLARDHPALDLMISELDPVGMPAALRSRRLDVALLHDYDIAPTPPDPALDSTALLEETVFLAVPSDAAIGNIAAGHASPDPISGARDAQWIIGSPGTLCHSVALHACQLAGFTPAVRHHADDFTAMLALVAAGQGVALIPQLAIAQPSPQVRLLPLAMRRRTRVAYRRGAGGHPAVVACVAALRDATTAFLD